MKPNPESELLVSSSLITCYLHVNRFLSTGAVQQKKTNKQTNKQNSLDSVDLLQPLWYKYIYVPQTQTIFSFPNFLVPHQLTASSPNWNHVSAPHLNITFFQCCISSAMSSKSSVHFNSSKTKEKEAAPAQQAFLGVAEPSSVWRKIFPYIPFPLILDSPIVSLLHLLKILSVSRGRFCSLHYLLLSSFLF